jgi:hypothetical protein
MARVFNATARMSTREESEGAIAMYLEPWHDDIDEFINLEGRRWAHGDRARDLFLALWSTRSVHASRRGRWYVESNVPR